MKLVVMLVAIAAAGCASQTIAPATGGLPAPAASSAPVPIADTIADAKKRGYVLVNQNGEEVVCRTELRTGSRLQKDTYCLTPAEYDTLRRRTEIGLANTALQIPPAQGK